MFGLHGRRPDAAVVKVLLGKTPAVCAPWFRIHVCSTGDFTMSPSSIWRTCRHRISLMPTSPCFGDSGRRPSWKVLTWMQSELDRMQTQSKRRYKSTPAVKCSFCGKWIKNDMHRHVVMFHLDLGQLWRCPVSWCTVARVTCGIVGGEGQILPAVDCSSRDLD